MVEQYEEIGNSCVSSRKVFLFISRRVMKYRDRGMKTYPSDEEVSIKPESCSAIAKSRDLHCILPSFRSRTGGKCPGI